MIAQLVAGRNIPDRGEHRCSDGRTAGWLLSSYHNLPRVARCVGAGIAGHPDLWYNEHLTQRPLIVVAPSQSLVMEEDGARRVAEPSTDLGESG